MREAGKDGGRSEEVEKGRGHWVVTGGSGEGGRRRGEKWAVDRCQGRGRRRARIITVFSWVRQPRSHHCELLLLRNPGRPRL